MTKQIRSDLQRKLYGFFEDAARPRGTTGDAGLAVGSTIGPHRTENQDRAAIGVVRFPHDHRPRLQVAIVCDGMGGLDHGGAAASEGISAFIAGVATLRRGSLSEALEKAVRLANRSVYTALQGRGGTTLTSIVTDGREAWCAHVGDSRLYSFSAEEGLNLLTGDDTVQGAIAAHEGLGDEDNLDNRLLQFVGIGDNLVPHIFRVPVKAGDIWIVTSDGAHSIGRKALEGLIRGSRSASEVVRKGVYVADALNVLDNASIAAMRQLETHDPEPPIGGTTISVSSPARSLEIWLFDSLEPPVDDALRQSELRNDAKDVRSEPEARHQVKTPTKSRARRKPQKKRTPKTEEQARMEILFESTKAE